MLLVVCSAVLAGTYSSSATCYTNHLLQGSPAIAWAVVWFAGVVVLSSHFYCWFVHFNRSTAGYLFAVAGLLGLVLVAVDCWSWLPTLALRCCRLQGYCLGLATECVGWPAVICCPCLAVNVGGGWFAYHGCRMICCPCLAVNVSRAGCWNSIMLLLEELVCCS
ncbi:PREDICTED: uncharacterized protein LOC105113257 isoform X2 [Populus euphratica]|uniref:Uncharacterized protein LOC105113257 isoform X2 n=1 Tax=Populus euphratica TaxID=75702 RepID=A0AAJ6TBV3_POPEU|nr:PREDICTED: uncharacterized protein LOC105113257 isoform X2 [Populus euphratica]